MRSQLFRLVPFNAPGTQFSDRVPELAIEITGTVALAAGTVNVIYQISGATDRVKYVGADAQPSRKNELWRTTCFELFVTSTVGTEYWEYNLAPSRDWNVYRFTAYRSELQQETRITDIDIATEVTQAGLTSLRAVLPLPPPLIGQNLAAGISSVIEDTAGNMHYFALRHGGAKPDFHDPAGFVLSFDPASA